MKTGHQIVEANRVLPALPNAGETCPIDGVSPDAMHNSSVLGG